MGLQSVTVGTPRAISTTGRERRRSARRSHIIEAFVSAAGDTARTEVGNVNLSRHGVGFSTPRPVTVGGLYLIEVGYGEQRLASEIRVVTCRDAGNGVFEVGAEFC